MPGRKPDNCKDEPQLPIQGKEHRGDSRYKVKVSYGPNTIFEMVRHVEP
jgi:hypothetical protein